MSKMILLLKEISEMSDRIKSTEMQIKRHLDFVDHYEEMKNELCLNLAKLKILEKKEFAKEVKD